MHLQDRVAVITGGGHGIGEAMVERFVAEGARAVVVADIDEARAWSVAARLGAVAWPCDVGDAVQLEGLIEKVERDIGPIDLFCSNAATFTGPEGGNLQTSDETWDRSWRVNCLAHVRAARSLVPRMLERGGGYLLQTLSAAALITGPSSVAYATTKHGALGFAEWLMLNYGDKGIKVSVVCPAAVETRDGHFDSRPRTGDVQTPAEVADAIIEGLAEERFLILPNPRVGRWYARKTADYDHWVVENATRLGETRPSSPFLS
ncbi:MAG: SDR family oxidoreductase [Acidimicrobiales bacterium]|nr:SDR family oxidoreductase [Acidimicrobiales bacterium]